MPLPTAAELTDPNATNTQMKQRLGQLADGVASKEVAAALTIVGDYLTEVSKREIASLSESSAKYLIAKAIKKVAITNPIAGKEYEIRAVYKNSASNGSRISIADDTGTISSIIIPVETMVSGIQEYSLSGNRNGKVLIDWDVLPSPLQVTNLGLFFDNDTYLQTYLNTAASAENSVAISAIGTRTTALEDFARIGLPAWLPDSAISAFKAAPEIQKTVAGAIEWIEMQGTTPLQYVRIATVTKNDATFGSRITMVNNLGAELCRFSASSSIVKSGVEVVDLAERNSSGVTAKLKINWDALADGVSVSGSSALVVKWDAQDNSVESVKVKVLENTNEIEQIQSQLADVTQQSISKVATKPYKVAIAGSSITWGQGYLGEGSYVGVVEQILRNQYAKTLHASTIAPNATTINGNDFYLGSAKRISGLNSEVSFNLDGDELSLSIARERENAGACLVELYIDNVLYDTFDTFVKPSVSRTENFTGNGSTIKFNLDGCFTYNHVVTVGGVAKVGKLATGNTIPSTDDYMIIRRYDSVNNRVVHALWFKEAPTGAIVVTYKQGENIRHLKGTIDRVGAGYSTALEYQYGDGSTAYDPANPTAISSGFGFRESDNRSVKTWKFSESKTRSYKLKIKALHSSATGATPYLDLNFVTNRMHHIMNAGIGGWSAVEFIDDAIKLNTIQEVINFNPDIVLIESCTNDDCKRPLNTPYEFIL